MTHITENYRTNKFPKTTSRCRNVDSNLSLQSFTQHMVPRNTYFMVIKMTLVATTLKPRPMKKWYIGKSSDHFALTDMILNFWSRFMIVMNLGKIAPRSRWGRNQVTHVWFLCFHTTFVFLQTKVNQEGKTDALLKKTTIFVYGGWFAIALPKMMILLKE